MTALLLSVLAATPGAIAYGRYDSGKWDITDWSKEPRVFVATQAAPLRDKPDANATVIAELRFGSPAQVLAAATPDHRWYRIASDGKAGYVEQELLTSARYEDDFDGDGDNELATVAFTPDFMIRVRFFEPKTKTESFVDVQPAGGAYLSMKGGYAYPEALKRQQAGVPLIHVGSHVEACADLVDYWVSYAEGSPRVALRQAGLVDPPNLATYKVEFQPAKKRALVHREKVEEEGQPPKQWTETWLLDGGVFVAPAGSP